MKYSITVDFEKDWGSRVDSDYAAFTTLDAILEAFGDAKGTFFVSTELLPRADALIKKISDFGHEIASHGCRHIRYDKLSSGELEKELSNSKTSLENLIAKRVDGFRTPFFAKHANSDEIADKFGYTYDASSVKVALKGRYDAVQHSSSDKIKHFYTSSIYGKLPAGIKWINIFGARFEDEEPIVIYSHPFDFLPIKTVLWLYDKNKIKPFVLAFYLARMGSPLSTLRSLSPRSQTLKSLM